MKISLALGPRAPLSRQTAWGCFMANLTVPGAGSLVAGRRTGYAQLALVVLGMLLTIGFGVPFIIWFVSHYAKLQDMQQTDPGGSLVLLWTQVRGSVGGMSLFAIGWCWALITSLRIIAEARPDEPKVPPKM